MIGHDEPMAIVVMHQGLVREIFYLGNVVPESGEMDKLQMLAKSKGYSLYLTQVDEPQTFASLYSRMGNL